VNTDIQIPTDPSTIPGTMQAAARAAYHSVPRIVPWDDLAKFTQAYWVGVVEAVLNHFRDA
jgi:hypothetical protein